MHLFLELLDLNLELVFLRVLYFPGPAFGLILHRRKQGPQGSALPPVIALAGDAQLAGRLLGGDLARPHLKDESGSLTSLVIGP